MTPKQDRFGMKLCHTPQIKRLSPWKNKSRSRKVGVFALWIASYIFCTLSAFANPPDAEKGLGHYAEAMEFYGNAQYEKAKIAIEEAHRVDPRPVYLGFRAWCIFRMGDQAAGLRIMVGLSQSTNLNSEERLDFEAAVSRMQDRAGTAQISIRTLGAAVEVQLDGIVQKPEAYLDAITTTPGSHTVIFRFQEQEEKHDVFIDENQLLELSYEAKGTIKFAKEYRGGSLFIDDKPQPLPPDLSVALAPGKYKIRIDKGTQTILRTTVELASGQEKNIAAQHRPAAPASIQGAVKNQDKRSGWVLPAALMATGAGLLAGGFYFRDKASVNADSVRTLKPAADSHVYSMSQNEAFRRFDDSKAQDRYATGLFAMGGATISGALIWWLLSGDKSESAQVGLHGESLYFRGAF